MWEHDWDQMVKDDPELLKWVRNYTARIFLNPRDAFFGGRTEAVKLYYKILRGERISYLDVTSL
jgi:hypothetical protein